MDKLLVTGGAGFIGSNFIRKILTSDSDCKIVNLDKLTYAGNLSNLAEFENHDYYQFMHGDIADGHLVNSLFERENFSHVINFAAETHVDRSILEPSAFVRTNIEGTQVLLEASRCFGISRYLQISTDEVYGSLNEVDLPSNEEAPLKPRSPYSASKSSADLLCQAYHHTFGVPVLIVRSCNAYGPFQHPEKFIPLMIHRASNDVPLPIYGDGRNIREWIHVSDLCNAIELVLRSGELGQIYNIGTGLAKRNIEIGQQILELLGKPESLIEFVKDRPGHDWRYAVDSTKLRSNLGWNHKFEFDAGLERTVEWFMENQGWIDSITSGEFEKYYEKAYAKNKDASHSRSS